MAGNEKRLIDANAIPYEKRTECFGHGEFFEVQKVYKEQIDKMPTVDAVEVVHGRWKLCDGCGHICSICGFWVALRSLNNYCPNCGADMRERNN